MTEPIERMSLLVDALVAAHAELGCSGRSLCYELAAELADAYEGLRIRIAQVFVRSASQIQLLPWAALPKLPDDPDAVRLLRLSIPAFEGGFMMPPAKRDNLLCRASPRR
jgi:hypothetical protein